MINRWTVILLFVLAACASKPKMDDDVLTPDPQAAKLPKFEQGLKALDQEHFKEAAAIFDKLLVSKPATELDLITLFNSGSAYEGLGDCKKASERYREVVRSSAGKYSNIEAQSFYRLSFMYECLGQDNKSVIALLDAKKRGSSLPYATLYAEIPARLAAGYARIGNRTKALEYFKLASQGLKKMVAEEQGHRQQQILAQSLFIMGQLNPAQRRAENDAISFLKGLSMQQPYLLQAVELNQQPWSQKAADDLETAYANIWKYKFSSEGARREFYIRGIQAANELNRIRLPKPDPAVDLIFKHVEEATSRLQTELAKIAETNRLTPEAEKREGLKRQGRLVDPKPPKRPLSKKPLPKKR